MLRKGSISVVFAVLSIFTVIAGLSVASGIAAEDNTALVEKLVSGSPWKGTWDTGAYRGTLEIVFKLKEEELIGAIQNGTGAPRNFDGPLSYFAIESGVMKFQNRVTGANYELSVDERGALKGYSQTRSGPRATIVLAPSRQ